jgi:LysM repeat protein
MAKLGKFNLFVISESPDFAIQTTSYPVEKGIAYTDHVKQEPETMQLEVFLHGNDYQKQLESLKKSMYNGEMMNYAGRFIMRNVIIENVSPDANSKAKNGVMATLKLRQIRVATTPYVKTTTKNKTQTKPTTNTGQKQPIPKKQSPAVYHVIKKGDTYWALAKKYGTTVTNLRKLNPGVDERKLQIGSKIRVK